MSRFPTRALLAALAFALSPVVFAQYYDGQPHDDRSDARYSAQQYPSDPYSSDRYANRYRGGQQSDRVLHDEVHDAIEAVLGHEARGISVNVRGGHVYLSGSVRDSRVRSIAHDIAHDVPGVHGVYVNRLYTARRGYSRYN